MHRRILAAATTLIAPVATLATALPASASPVPASTTRVAAKAPVTHLGTMRILPRTTQHCSGTPVMRVPGLVKKVEVAELDVYLLPKNGGTVVACMRHVGPARGVHHMTSVLLAGAPKLTSKTGLVAVGHGWDRYYSGPAAIGGIKGNCFSAAGAMEISKKLTITLETKPVCVKK